jgi:hypothetical protein
MSPVKAIILALALLAVGTRAVQAVPTYEMFLIDPLCDTVKIIYTDHGDLENVEVTLSKSRASSLFTFSQRNLGKRAMFGLLQRNKNCKEGTICFTFIEVKAPMRDGILHFSVSNPYSHHRTGTGGILIAQ